MTEQPTLDPRRSALLVMDYQKGIVERFDDDGLLDRVQAAIGTARASGAQVGFVRVGFTEADYASMPATNKTFVSLASSRLFHADAPETAIDERLGVLADDIVVRKTRVGSFSTTDLGDQLKSRGRDALVLAGIATSGVVLSTVREAADRDYELFVLSDGCADQDPEVHDVLLNKVFPRQAQVLSIGELATLFGGA